MKRKIISPVIFIGIFLLAAFFRLYGVNWDQNQHLHPDERFLTMVATGISWPKSFAQYLDTANSPLNPHNRSFGFFVYGTFPVFFTKWVAEELGKGDYTNLTIVGRQLSAVFDLGTVVLVFLIAKQINPKFKAQNPNQVQSSKSKHGQKYKKVGFWILDFIGHLDLGFWIFPFLSMFLYSIMVLPIQLSHFYAVDTYMNFFITLSFYLLIKILNSKGFNSPLPPLRIRGGIWGSYTLLGVSFGLAIASKISAIVFLPIIVIGLLWKLVLNKKIINFLLMCFLSVAGFYFTIRLAQPYLYTGSDLFDFSLNEKILANWKELAHYWRPDSGFPPSIQWFYIIPLLYPLKNLVLWGMGLPLGILSISGITYFIFLFLKNAVNFCKKVRINRFFVQLTDLLREASSFILFMMTVWILFLFIYQGIQPAPTLRYFIHIYPFLSIVTSYFILEIYKKSRFPVVRFVLVILILTSLVWPISFVSIYSRPHSRVAASEWIYKNVPANSTIANEHWDDGLPMSLGSEQIHETYKFIEFPLYNADSLEKWENMSQLLNNTDYISLSSNRLWASLTRVADKYPTTSRYYHLLFSGKLGFRKVAEITSYPNLPLSLFGKCLYFLPNQENFIGLKSDKSGLFRLGSCSLYQKAEYRGLVIRDDFAEEAFTVYDHPKVLIFKNVERFPGDKLLELITANDYVNSKQ